jgi:hypothetical protein
MMKLNCGCKEAATVTSKEPKKQESAFLAIVDTIIEHYRDFLRRAGGL